jgi:serine/threonine protein kinase
MGIGPGSLLAGRYRTGTVLGTGGCATVYAAHDELLGRDVAVKVWSTDAAWADETRLTAQLHHPGVVVVHDGGVTGDATYLVMELVDGPSLARVLQDGALPRGRAVRIVSQLAHTLALVHADGIVHGDVKPANVLLAAGDRVVLADFGVAQPSLSAPADVVLGTPQYLSPEQVRGQPVTAATDVYATGLVLLECLTGRPGYPGSAVGPRWRGLPGSLRAWTPSHATSPPWLAR